MTKSNQPFIFIYFFVLLIIQFTACDSNTTNASPPPSGDLTGYTLESLPGTDLQRATIVRADGSLQEQGYVRNGKKTGAWIVYYATKGMPKTITNYADGNLDGVFLQFSERGQIEARTNYRMNEYDGLAMTYKFGRPVTENNYKNGKLNGTSRVYHETTGKLQTETEYKNNQQHGAHRVYNEEGKVVVEYTYADGEKVSGGMVN